MCGHLHISWSILILRQTSFHMHELCTLPASIEGDTFLLSVSRRNSRANSHVFTSFICRRLRQVSVETYLTHVTCTPTRFLHTFRCRLESLHAPSILWILTRHYCLPTHTHTHSSLSPSAILSGFCTLWLLFFSGVLTLLILSICMILAGWKINEQLMNFLLHFPEL